MVCIKCGSELEQTRCDNCGYEHSEPIRLLEKPEETELILSWNDINTRQLQFMIRQKEAALVQLRRILQEKNGSRSSRKRRKPQDGQQENPAPTARRPRRPRGREEQQVDVQVDSMEMYLQKLTELYLENDKKELTDEQIGEFLTTYRLTERYGVIPQWVRLDLARIEKENA